jgi:hypothetical protein
MIGHTLWLAALWLPMAAQAAVPQFAAKCGPNLAVEAKADGKVYMNGRSAKMIKRPDGQISANSAGAWVDITPQGSAAPIISYTAKDKSNGMCQMLSAKAADAPVSASAAKRPSHTERAGLGQFDASGEIPCAQTTGQPMRSCKVQVARDPGGNASVKVTHLDGRTRFITFLKGKAVSADLSQADGDMRFKATKESDLFKIQAGRERYEIPEAVVFGG